MTTVTITSRTKFGFAINTCPSNRPNGGYYFEAPTSDQIIETGTLRTISERINENALLKSLRSGGTFYSRGWFIRYNGQWYKVNWEEVEIGNTITI